ncbi:hypothetical protein E6O51_12725 [Pseudothauera rhizosphaerae]|uniref:SdpI/YhfL protein family protein n=2 Tax=Pseudothauera rhizosphaerae TaxID=2565932 RepID=A0A4S4ANF4_9RHOO|nr:hypothetical protein [Pseudothauera rhizosphaerae]THF60732.1 hypothetical protein E6O51_12725 [Pseudothauera rhizosphaerae]
MAPHIHLVLNWILFLALFPIAFVWLRRAWRIIARRDFSEVALKRGEPPENPAKFAPFCAAINLLGGIVVVWLIFGVAAGLFAHETWTSIGGITIWSKFLFDFALSRQAHMPRLGRAAAAAARK